MKNIHVSLIAYSECTVTQKRIATFAVTAPKFIQAHINSHRILSRNSGSSRAIPGRKMRAQALHFPFVPVYFGENKPGMQSGESFKGVRLWVCKKTWLWSRYVPILFHYIGEKANLHKEVLNRIIEPWLTIDIVVTATEWDNFINLRAHAAAQPEMQLIASQIQTLLATSVPQRLSPGSWHLPFILRNEYNLDDDVKKKLSAARCARVSYKLFDGSQSNLEKDKKLCSRLINDGHWSPFEHQAESIGTSNRSGNFIGWKQHRKEYEHM